MKAFTNTYNLIAGFVVTILTAIFGAYWYIFATYMLLNMFDWGTGWYKSWKLKKENSRVGLQGIVKKLGYWIIIAVAFLMSTVFVRMGKDVLGMDLDFLMLVGWFTLACLMVNEVRSILENLVESGCNVPAVLTSGLEVVAKMIIKESEGDEDE